MDVFYFLRFFPLYVVWHHVLWRQSLLAWLHIPHRKFARRDKGVWFAFSAHEISFVSLFCNPLMPCRTFQMCIGTLANDMKAYRNELDVWRREPAWASAFILAECFGESACFIGVVKLMSMYHAVFMNHFDDINGRRPITLFFPTIKMHGFRRVSFPSPCFVKIKTGPML